jgi:hypothetical protein
VSSVSGASTPSLMPARLPRLSRRGWSRSKASGNGGLCRVRSR